MADELPGTVRTEMIRCGKPNCRCTHSGERHGPYYYRYWREGGRLRKAYVPREEAATVRQACGRRQDRERRAREERQALRLLLRLMQRQGRDAEAAVRIIKSL